MGQVSLQFFDFAFQAIGCTFKFMIQTLYLIISVAYYIFQLGVFDLHDLHCLAMVIKDVVQLSFVLPRVRLFDVLDLSVLFYL